MVDPRRLKLQRATPCVREYSGTQFNPWDATARNISAEGSAQQFFQNVVRGINPLDYVGRYNKNLSNSFSGSARSISLHEEMTQMFLSS